MMERVKFGVVGLGNLGELHINHLQNRIPEAEVVAVCDVMEGRVKEIQEKYGIADGFTDFDEMIGKAELDAVAIITNVQTHCDLIVKACEKKLHIFCEKPLSLDLDECKKIEEAVAKNDTKLFTIGFMRRFDPAYADAKKRLEAGEIGKPIIFKSTACDGIQTIGINLEKAKSGAFHPWFFEMGIHDCDLSRWFLGAEAVEAFSVCGSYAEPEFAGIKEDAYYDNGFALARMDNGTAAYIHVGMTAPCADVEGELIGTEGIIRINAVPRKNRVQILKDGYISEEGIFDFYERWGEAFYLEMKDFIGCIQNGGEPKAGVQDGINSLKMAQMLQASYESSKQN